jgi:XTP/dITP diphosphohydrolase
MKQVITFATGNARKLREAEEGCNPYGVTVEQAVVDFLEIQSDNPFDITRHKAEQAFNALQRPVVVNDASWSIPALGGFPGAYMKDVANWFAPEDFIQLINRHKNREISLIECIYYKDATQTNSFIRKFTGEITTEPRGNSGISIEKVVLFNNLTIAEWHNQNKMAFEAKDFIWADFGKWYAGL